jgi:hypothetical protein
LVAFCLVAGPSCDRLARNVEWERTYGGPDLVEPVAIVRSPDSGYVVLANIMDKWTRAEGVWLLRLDEDGDTLWTRAFIIGGQTEADDLVPSSDGGFVVSGRTDAPDGSTPFLATVRAYGDVVTKYTWPELRGSGLCRIAGAAEGTVVMAGDHGWNTAFVQRATPTGYVVWATTCSLESKHPWVRDIARLASGAYFICGDDFGLGVSDTGEHLWSRDYSSLGSVEFRAVDTAVDGGLFLGGCVYTEKGSRIICARVTSTGELMWSRRVDDPPASGWSVCAGSGGSCYVVGGTDETDSDDGILVKFDAEGNIEWQREFNGPGYGSMVSATQAPDGDIVTLGSANEKLQVLKVHP